MNVQENGWLRYSNSNTVIIFIHGLFSSSKKCWFNDKNQRYWPDLIASDPRFNGIDIFLANFYTSIDSNDYGVQNCSDEVWDHISQTDKHMRSPALSKSNIIFVTHSTGGIIARYILESKSDKFVGKKIGLALYASPSFGSRMASSFGWIAKRFKNQLAQELAWGSALLDDLDGRFKELLQSSKLDIVGLECYENRSPFHLTLLNHSKHRVVSKESAARYFGKAKLIAGTDHSSIVKPENEDSQSHKALWGFIERNDFCKIKLTSSSTKTDDSKEDVLFDLYTPNQENFYLHRDVDQIVLNKFRLSGLWICGPSGVGKTAIIQRMLFKNGVDFQYISLGTSINENIQQMFTSIAYDLDENVIINESERISVILNNIELIIRDKCKSDSFVLFIEEIPISDHCAFKEFSQCIYSILVKLKEIKNFKLVLSSIFEPDSLVGTEFEKISDNFSIFSLGYWNKEDLIELDNIINRHLNIDNLPNVDIELIEGSPRKLKSHYRESLDILKARS